MLSAPGAKSIHHAYAGGLLEHTLAIMRICRAMAGLYPQVDKEILLVGALCHDLGKAFELSHGISREYTDAGRLLGHIQIGLEVLETFLRKVKDLPEDLAMHLKHLVISHHGELEFGSPCRPQTVEAFILHYADNMDSKINTVQSALTASDGAEATGWSDYHRTLGRYLFQPARTPARADSPERQPRKAATRTEDSPLLKAMGLSSTPSNS
jgi:3'-5' exoribonuclease